MDSPFLCFLARRVGIDTSVLSIKKQVKKSFSKPAQFLIEPTESFMNNSEATHLRVPINKQARMESFDITFSVWDLK